MYRRPARSGVNSGLFMPEQSTTTTNILPGVPSPYFRRPSSPSVAHSSGSSPSGSPSNLRPSPASCATAPRLSVIDNVKLYLTHRPAASMAIGLEGAVEEARRTLDATSVTGAKLIAAAEEKLEQARTSYQRCLRLRAERVREFEGCALISECLRRLYMAASTTSDNSKGSLSSNAARAQLESSSNGSAAAASVSAPRRSDLLSLHLTLTREGFLAPTAVGEDAGAFPFCWAAPSYVRYDETDKRRAASAEEALTMAGGGEELLAEWEGVSSNLKKKEEPGAKPSDLAVWDDGIRAWRVLQARGDVERFANTLTFPGFLRAMFELADAHLTHAEPELHTPFGRDVPRNLQDYLDFSWRLVRSCVGQAATPATPPSGTTSPPPSGTPSPSPTPTLKHSWPPCDEHWYMHISASNPHVTLPVNFP